jgi:hypothetical protein
VGILQVEEEKTAGPVGKHLNLFADSSKLEHSQGTGQLDFDVLAAIVYANINQIRLHLRIFLCERLTLMP